MASLFAKSKQSSAEMNLLATATIVLLLTSSSAVKWNFCEVALDDGAIADGSFDYDAVTGTFSNSHVETSNGNVYKTVLEQFSERGWGFAALKDDTNGRVGAKLFFLAFEKPLLAHGGTVDVRFANEATCTDSICEERTSDNSLVQYSDPFVTTHNCDHEVQRRQLMGGPSSAPSFAPSMPPEDKKCSHFLIKLLAIIINIISFGKVKIC